MSTPRYRKTPAWQFLAGPVIVAAVILTLASMGAITKTEEVGFIQGQRVTPARLLVGSVRIQDHVQADKAFLKDSGDAGLKVLVSAGKASILQPGAVLEVLDRSGYLTQVKALGEAGMNTVWVYTNGLREVPLAFDAGE